MTRKGYFQKILELPATRIMKDTQGCIWLHCDNALHRIEFNDKGEVQIPCLPLSPVYLNGPDIALKDIDEDGKNMDGKQWRNTKSGIKSAKETDNHPHSRLPEVRNGTYIWISSAKRMKSGSPVTADYSVIIKAAM